MSHKARPTTKIISPMEMSILATPANPSTAIKAPISTITKPKRMPPPPALAAAYFASLALNFSARFSLYAWRTFL